MKNEILHSISDPNCEIHDCLKEMWRGELLDKESDFEACIFTLNDIITAVCFLQTNEQDKKWKEVEKFLRILPEGNYILT
jgi:hypothetical protein